MLLVLSVPATLVLLLWALYNLGWEGSPRATGAFAHATVGAITFRSVAFVVQALDDPGGIFVCYDLEVTTRPPEDTAFGFASGTGTTTHTAQAVRIDLATGVLTRARLGNPFDRERFVVYDAVPVYDEVLYEEVPLNVGALLTRFRGIRIPRPELILINYFGDGAPKITFDPALTGRERLVRTRGGETLLTRTLINGRDFRQSRRGRLAAFQSHGDGPLVCLYSTKRDTTVWLFHNSQEKR